MQITIHFLQGVYKVSNTFTDNIRDIKVYMYTKSYDKYFFMCSSSKCSEKSMNQRIYVQYYESSVSDHRDKEIK